MFLVGLLGWWYGDGWRARLHLVGHNLSNIAELFSLAELSRTLFAPFRQISASGVNGPVDAQWRAFVDKTISRVVGAIVRLIVIVAGMVTILVTVVLQAIVLIFWLAMPLLIVAGIIITIIGWVPKWR